MEVSIGSVMVESSLEVGELVVGRGWRVMGSVEVTMAEGLIRDFTRDREGGVMGDEEGVFEVEGVS